MKRNLIALAALSTAGAACAQSSVTLFGILDVALTHGRADGAGSTRTTQMTSGNLATSRIGFRGVEDLGGGLSASFWLEGQVGADDGRAGSTTTLGNQAPLAATGLNFARRSTVSLTGGWGEVRLGRDVGPSYWNHAIFDPFVNVGVGINVMVLGAVQGLGANAATFGIVPAGQGTAGPYARISNMVGYYTPADLGGLYAHVAYWTGENAKNGAANEDDGTGGGLRVGYTKGPFNAAIGWGRTRYRATPVAATAGAPSGDFNTMNVGASWNFGGAQLLALYGRDTRESAVKAEGRGWLVGTIVPVGPAEIRASFSQYRIDGGTGIEPNARKLALGYVYNLSKRTALYAVAARVSNADGARISVGGATFGPSVTNGRATGLDLGMRHTF